VDSFGFEMSDLSNPETPLFPPGALPLRKPAHEIFARERALMLSPLQAARKAGFTTMSPGNAAKLDRKRKIRDRVAYLSHQEEDVLRDKRARLESFLWVALEADPCDFFEDAEEPIVDEEGKPVLDAAGNPCIYRFQRLRPFSEIDPELRRLIEGLTYTEKGKPNLKTVPKLQANIELRRMLGIDAPPRGKLDVDHSGAVTLEMLIKMSMAEREKPQGTLIDGQATDPASSKTYSF
jgi:hypothetical protein